jgi:hypothetical protein
LYNPIKYKDIFVIKWKIKSHTVGTIPKSNIKIVEREKIDTPSTQTHDLSGSKSHDNIHDKLTG